MNSKKHSLTLPIFLIILFSSCLCNAEKIPSCLDQEVKGREVPGVSAACSPTIFTRDDSYEFMKRFNVRRIKDKWYMFLTKKDFYSRDKFTIKGQWIGIARFVSSIQSIYNSGADCYIIKVPETDQEKTDLLNDDYPAAFIAATAKFIGTGEQSKDIQWLEYHHHVLYRLTVY